jgi:hypothetical protein
VKRQCSKQRETMNIDEFVKSRIPIEFIIPAKAGIQLFHDILDPGFRRGDNPRDFLRDHLLLIYKKNNLSEGALRVL